LLSRLNFLLVYLRPLWILCIYVHFPCI
jgi:hypothetical protein